jgi:hypothetical protein
MSKWRKLPHLEHRVMSRIFSIAGPASSHVDSNILYHSDHDLQTCHDVGQPDHDLAVFRTHRLDISTLGAPPHHHGDYRG